MLNADEMLGRYKLRSSIGKGGMGQVFLAEDTELERLVALKVLDHEFTDDADRVRRFVREAKAVSALNHPNILTVYEIGISGDSRFIATEFIKGSTLRELIRNKGLSLHSTLDIALQIASALNAAHDAGIVHRDIKPENVMIRGDGLVKVLDFGLAKLSARDKQTNEFDEEEANLTKPGMIMGTASYMSPEQTRGKDTDARTDVWSLGVVIYEMLAGHTPFIGETTSDKIAAILGKEPPPLDPAIPAELRRIVNKSLQKNRDDRFQTIKDLLIDLKSLKHEVEFSEDLRRSHIPPFSGSSDVSVAQNSKTELLGGTDAAVSETDEQRPPNVTVRSISSAEFVVQEVRKHRFASLGAFLALILALGGAAYYFVFTPTGKPAIDTIAVLPFVNSTGDAGKEYLSDGLSQALINNLSQLPELKVIASSSTFKYKNVDIDPKDLAEKLGVQAIVMGRVEQNGEAMTINVELINAADKTLLWGKTYDRRVADTQSIQADIVQSLSDKLQIKPTGQQQQSLAKHSTKATSDPRAYQLYLNGLFQKRGGGESNFRKALDYYQQAIALDPSFALSYVELASCYSYLGGNSLMDPKQANAKAKTAVQKALELDETLADAHAALAAIKLDEWEWDAAGAEFRRSIDINPSLASARKLYANYLSVLGRHEDALREVRLSRQLDPLDLKAGQAEGIILYLARRYEEAIRNDLEAIKADPKDSFTYEMLGYAYAMNEEFQQAIENYNTSIKLGGESSRVNCYLGYALAMAGRKAEALALLNKIKSSKEYVSPGELAALYAGLGDKENAFAMLEKAFNERDLQMQYILVEPHYDPLRSDPRYAELIRRVGLNVGA